MQDLLKNERFNAAYERLAAVSLNPRRHTAKDARAHSEAVATMAIRLGAANSCTATQLELLENLGRAHDIGKITGTARPERSLEVLAACQISHPTLLALVKWHDTSLPWYHAAQRGQAPSDKAWRRLQREVDLRLLCMFMVADRVDAPGGWRRNAPTTWFISEVQSRGLVAEIELDVDGHPSEVCAGAALVTGAGGLARVLVTRTRANGFELPKGGIEWDELPAEAAIRELQEESGIDGEFEAGNAIGQLDYLVDHGRGRHLKRVHYYRVYCAGKPTFAPLPRRTHERMWLGQEEARRIPLVNEGLREMLRSALSSPLESNFVSNR